MYFDQLSGAAGTQKLVKTPFLIVFNLFCLFHTFFSDFSAEIKKNGTTSVLRSMFDHFMFDQRLFDRLKNRGEICVENCIPLQIT